jgi:hypothetical protein
VTTIEPVTTKPVTIEPVTTEPVMTEPPPSHVGAYVPPPTRLSGAPRAGNRVRIWTTGGAVALAAFAYLALHARPHAASVSSSPMGISRTTTTVPEPVSLPSTPQAPPTAVSNATSPVLEISELPPDARERPGSMGRLRFRRATSVRALAPLRERPPPRPNPPSPPPVAPVHQLDRTPATPEKPPEVQIGQDLKRQQSAHRPRGIDQDNPFR